MPSCGLSLTRNAGLSVRPVVHPFHIFKELENMMWEEGLKGMSLFSQRSESIISFIDCLMVVTEKAEPDCCRKSTMRGHRSNLEHGKFD